MQSAVTISLVPEASGGPFVYWDDFAAGCAKAKQLGYDAVELFAPGPDRVTGDEIREHVFDAGLKLAAVGTGAGAVLNGLTLIDPVVERRVEAGEFIGSMIAYGAQFDAPAIIGSMQGRVGKEMSRETCLQHLADALSLLGKQAEDLGVPLIYEPLNRYETNLFCRLEEAADFIRELDTTNVKLLADLFHMNIEEADVPAAIRRAGAAIGHVHFVDSNRQAAGFGHTDFEPILEALREIGYDGYLSAEAFALPDSDTAAEQTITRYRELVGQ